MPGAGPKDLRDIKDIEGLNKDELIRACRLSIQAELDAISLYEMIANTTDDKLAAEVMQEVANEEKNHVGEFLKLVEHLDPDEVNIHYKKGEMEVLQHMGSQGGNQGRQQQQPGEQAAQFAQDDYSQYEDRHRKILDSLNEEMDIALKE